MQVREIHWLKMKQTSAVIKRTLSHPNVWYCNNATIIAILKYFFTNIHDLFHDVLSIHMIQIEDVIMSFEIHIYIYMNKTYAVFAGALGPVWHRNTLGWCKLHTHYASPSTLNMLYALVIAILYARYGFMEACHSGIFHICDIYTHIRQNWFASLLFTIHSSSALTRSITWKLMGRWIGVAENELSFTIYGMSIIKVASVQQCDRLSTQFVNI